MISYPIVVYHTPEDGGYFARVPALPGSTTHGEMHRSFGLRS